MVTELITQQDKPNKIKFILECEFYKKTGDYVEYSYSYLHRKVEIVTETSNLEELYQRAADNILEKVDNFQNKGSSGWKFERVVALDIHIDNYDPISAKSYIDLTSKLKLKKTIVIPENEDNHCLKWAVIAAMFPAKRD